MKKRILSVMLVLAILASIVPSFTINAAVASKGKQLVDFALSCRGKRLNDFPQDNVTQSLNNAWCAWFTTYCASKVGICGSPSNYTSGLFPPIEKSTWGNTSPEWAATNQSYQAGWMTKNDKGKLYYYSMCTSGRCGINQNTIRVERNSFQPQAGDLIYFDWGHDGWWDHVAIVTDCSNGSGTYVGGNQNPNSTVSTSSFSCSNLSVVAFLRPNYCEHPKSEYSSLGKCGKCGQEFDWKATESMDGVGEYKVIKAFKPRTDAPYSAAKSDSNQLKPGATVTVTASYKNAFGNTWYKISYNGGASVGYVSNSDTKYVEKYKDLDSKININIIFPAEGQTIKRQSQSFCGAITSLYPIKEVTLYLDNSKQKTVSTNTYKYELKDSQIDYALLFNKCNPGRHEIKLVVKDSMGGSQSATRVFYTESYPCEEASISTEDDIGGKWVTMSCSGANIRYSTNTGLSGSGSGSVKEYIKGTTTFTITTSRSGRIDNAITRTVSVEQVRTPEFQLEEKYDGTYVTITSTPGATIYYDFNGPQDGQYVGTFRVDRDCTINARAYKDGMKDSEKATINIEMPIPSKPIVQLFDTESKIAVGKTAVFKWTADSRAGNYIVSLYKDGSLIKTAEQSDNLFSYVLDSSGEYGLSVKACGLRGDSAESERVTVTAMSPLTVKFLDDDESLLNEYTINYGEYITKQATPSHKGHYFSGWSPTNNYTESPVTQNMTFKATYTPIEYDVTFYDVDGTKFGETQKIPYQKSAVAPDYSGRVPTGFAFAGWTVIEASDKDSLCDYTCVDANLKLQAVVRWAHEELPVYAKIKSATSSPVDGAPCYSVTVDLTNWPTSTSDVYVCVALKSQHPTSGVYKTVYADRTHVKLTANANQSVTLTLPYAGIASTAEVVVLERKADDTTGSAYSLTDTAQVVFSTLWTDWSEWSTSTPAAKEDRYVESKTEYRYKTKETTTSSSSSMSGWTQYDSSWKWGSYGSWSSWSTNYVGSNDSTQVETRTGYHYYYYVCSNCGAHMHGYGRCYTWAGGCGSSAVYSNSYHSLKAATPYSSASDFHGTGVFYTNNTDEGRAFAYIYSSSPYYVAPATQYRYRTRSQIWTYYFYRWSAWSAWSENAATASSTKQVETRTLYRYRDEVHLYSTDAGAEDTSGKAYTISGNLSTEQDLNGKVATIMVYQSKNMDPNQYQMQYLGQTTLTEGNHYEFSFIPIKEPTTESGNYVVSLGVQGATGLLSVDVVMAPTAQYTVRFLKDDGSVISTQLVDEGENAVTPNAPKKEGHRFIGWSERTTDIYKNCDIYAQYEKESYTVVFVDWLNETIGFQTGNFGDEIVAPYSPTAEGHSFKGWDVLLKGNHTITGNQVVVAVYEAQQFTVRFHDEKGAVKESQKVDYGEAAVLPAALEVTGMEFLGWSTDNNWWNVTKDVDVYPLLAYTETVASPVINGESVVSGVWADMELTTDPDATTYYTTDGTIPTKRSPVYSEMLHFEETTQVIAVSSADGKNDSEPVYFLFIYDDTPQERPADTLIELDTKTVNVAANQSVPIEVEMKYNPGLIAFKLIVECDRSVFYLGSADERVCLPGEVTKYGSFTVIPHGTSGWEILWLNPTPCTGDGLAFTLPLMVGEESVAGDYQIKLSYADESARLDTGDAAMITAENFHFSGTEITHIHSYASVVTAPTCTEQGYTTYTCSCGDRYKDNYIAALGHAWDNGVVTKEPTETTEGEKLFTCTVCAKTRTEKIPATGTQSNPFDDMNEDDYFFQPVLWAVGKNITKGTSATTFSPNEPCTRAQAVTFLWRANGSPKPIKTDNPFKDVKAGQYYYDAVLWAVETGITNGTSTTTFEPDAKCTRGQIVTFQWRSAGQPTPTKSDNPFKDVTARDYYYSPVLWAVENGITNGTSNTTFGPNDFCTRGHIVTFLYRQLAK